MPEPINTRLPETERAVQNKYQNNPGLFDNVPSPVATALLALDIQRSQRGQNPLSVRQTQLALQANLTGEAVTLPPDNGFWGGITDNLRQLATSIPRLPLAMYREAMEIGEAPAAISEAMGAGNPLDIIAGVAQAPGVRLLPGAFIAGNINNPSNLVQNPLFTALDVLPGAKALGAGKLVSRVAQAPKVVQAGQALGRTRIGGIGREMFGTTARDVAQLENEYSAAMREAAFGHGPINDPLAAMVREAGTLRNRYPNIAEDRRIELTRLMSEDKLPGNLPAEELAFVNEARELGQQFGHYGVSQDLLTEIDGEFFDPGTGNRILSKRRKAEVAGLYGEARNLVENPTSIRQDFIGEVGNDTHITRTETGMADPQSLLDLSGAKGEIRGQHVRRQGVEWQEFVKDIQTNGVKEPIFITVDSKGSLLSEGNHRLDAAIEAGLKEIPVEIRYFGHSEQNTRSFINTASTILSKMEDITFHESLSTPQKLDIITGYAHALDAAGFDASSIFQRIRDYRNTAKKTIKYSDDDFRNFLSTVTDSITPRQVTDIDAFIDELGKLARTDGNAAILREHLRLGNWQKAKAQASIIARRKRFAIPGIEEAIDEIIRRRERNRYLRKTANFSPKGVARIQKSAETIAKSNPPARFQPVIDKMVQEGLIAKYTDSPDFDKIIPLLKERNYGFLDSHGLIPDSEVRALQLELKRTWQDMKRAGVDPVFVHKVSEHQIGSIKYPRVLERIPRPTQTQKRSMNVTPTIDDVSVALTHQGLEWLAKRGSEEFIDQIMSRWGRTQQQLLEQYLPAARVAAKTPDDVLGIAERLFKKEWQKYDPKTHINWPSPRIKRWGQDEIWLPKTVANNIQRMHTPPGGRLSAITDPIMQVFRTSLLPLSPRWHLYNIIGGGLLLTVGTDPTVWRYLKHARDLSKSGEVPEGIPRGIGTVPRDVLEWSTTGSIQKDLGAIFHHKAGQTLSRLWDETQEARKKVGNLIEWSYNKNGAVDDMYRTMAYLYGNDKALTKGLTKEAAHRAGIESARKIFQQWDRMTPLERTIMRFVFPFYGWTAHVMRFIVQYPFDHPIRTAIMGSFARNELEDHNSGLPERFLNMFFLGDMDKNGNVKAFNIGGMNPFADVANNLTLRGWLGQANPIISTAAQSLGIDTGTGGPELFPNMQYDAETGRLAYRSRNPLMLLAENILPQSRVLLGFADSSSEFQQLLRSNPEAAGRLMMSQAGLPIIFRQVNQPQEIAKREIAADEAQSQALNESLKSGDWDRAQSFPNLRPLLQRIAQLQESGQLENYTPLSAGQSAISLAQNALLHMVSPPDLPTEISR